MITLKKAARNFGAFLLSSVLIGSLLFALSDHKYSFSYWSAYSSDGFSEASYEYYQNAIAALESDFSDAPKIKSIKVIHNDRSDITFKIAYQFKSDKRTISVTPNPEDIGVSDAWIDFSPSAEVRVSSSEHEDYGQGLLTNYAIDTKKIIDVAVSSVRSHIKDQNEWSDVFSQSGKPNRKQEKSS